MTLRIVSAMVALALASCSLAAPCEPTSPANAGYVCDEVRLIIRNQNNTQFVITAPPKVVIVDMSAWDARSVTRVALPPIVTASLRTTWQQELRLITDALDETDAQSQAALLRWGSNVERVLAALERPLWQVAAYACDRQTCTVGGGALVAHMMYVGFNGRPDDVNSILKAVQAARDAVKTVVIQNQCDVPVEGMVATVAEGNGTQLARYTTYRLNANTTRSSQLTWQPARELLARASFVDAANETTNRHLQDVNGQALSSPTMRVLTFNNSTLGFTRLSTAPNVIIKCPKSS
ncbi:hypothetical protein [Deinococcus humi]|uniref:Lipoprotein n=1 Tax=Deinococcus humi TaxID=662880 RepID=A0A7W8NFR8_9DEIO|nr:hypothetical protein [Deinococcus humi]MBB5365729.1 hypothetical protein [Deinococcus humi]